MCLASVPTCATGWEVIEGGRAGRALGDIEIISRVALGLASGGGFPAFRRLSY